MFIRSLGQIIQTIFFFKDDVKGLPFTLNVGESGACCNNNIIYFNEPHGFRFHSFLLKCSPNVSHIIELYI